VRKSIGDLLGSVYEQDYPAIPETAPLARERLATPEQRAREIASLEKQMRKAAKDMEYERAAELRDRIRALRELELGTAPGA
jgi:excinuclease ABC subunit B